MALLGDHGRLVLRAWWQGRMITLLRETSASSRKRRRKSKTDVPSAFQDLISGLDMSDLADEDSGEDRAE